MFRRLFRPLGFVLLVVLAAAPVVRTLCAWDCGPSPAASEASDHAEHCAPPAGSAEARTAGLVPVDGCENCNVLGETVRATVRTQTASLAPLVPPPSAATSDHDLTASHVASASAHAPSPPLRAPYPLRI